MSEIEKLRALLNACRSARGNYDRHRAAPAVAQAALRALPALLDVAEAARADHRRCAGYPIGSPSDDDYDAPCGTCDALARLDEVLRDTEVGGE